MQIQSWKAKVVQAAVIIVAVAIGSRIAYEVAKPLILPAVIILVLAGLFSLLLRRR